MVNFKGNYCAMCITNHSLSQLSTRLNIITALQRATYHPSLNTDRNSEREKETVEFNVLGFLLGEFTVVPVIH